jgi:undecaprenyl-diphosphatase
MLPGRQDRWQHAPRAGVVVIVAGVALVGFVALAVAIALAPAFVRFDLAASSAIRSLYAPWAVSIAEFVTRIGDFWPMVALTGLTGLVLWLRGRHTSGLTLVLAVLSGTIFGSVLKLLFMRVRPALDMARIPIPDTYSFPSGHALASVLYFGSLVLLIMLHEKSLRRAAAASALCVLAALAISMSRVYLGVHYLGDVVGSWLLGIAWLALVVLVSARWGAGSTGDDIKGRGAAEA